MEYIFITAGAIISLILFACLLLKFDMKVKRTAIYIVSLMLSLFLSKLLLDFESGFISNKLGALYSITYSYYLTMILFLAFSAVINKICRVKTENTGLLAGAPLMVFLVIARIGCYFNGCCFAVIGNKTIPLNLIESGIALITMILVSTKVIKPTLCILIFYSIFRLATDFFKTSYIYEEICVLTMPQILYIIVILIATTILIINHFRGEKIYEKK